jgi:hypothetical protein
MDNPGWAALAFENVPEFTGQTSFWAKTRRLTTA